MTYILGVRRGDVAAIFADSQLTTIDPSVPPNYGGVKCGILFPGCIYGVSGWWQPAMKYLHDVRRAVKDVTDPHERWSLFEDVCKHWNNTGDPFEVLFSSRHLGRPRFYMYHSLTRRLIMGDRDDYSLGSGKTLYSAVVERLRAMPRTEVTNREYPYILSAFLNETVSSPEANSVAGDHDVGGYFNFVTQGMLSEERQRKSLYVLLYPPAGREPIRIHRRRVAYRTHPLLGDILMYYDKWTGNRAKWAFGIQNPEYRTFTADEIGIPDWFDEAIFEHSHTHPYYFLNISIANSRFYAVVQDFLEPDKNIVLADLTDHVDQPAIDFLLEAHERQRRGDQSPMPPLQCIGQHWSPAPPPRHLEWVDA